MPIGTIKKIVYLSQQAPLANARLVSDHNKNGYGVIEGADGREVYFPYDAVERRWGFDDLRRGAQVEYALEIAPYLRAKSVGLLAP